MALVQVKNIDKFFGSFQALKNVDFELAAGEKYFIQGSSGSGKSTLLYLLGGLDRPNSGQLIVDGHDLNNMNDIALAKYRNSHVGFIFQFHYLLSTMTAWDNILLPAKLGPGVKRKMKAELKELANLLGIGDCLSKYPYELSGGQQQRVNILRALSLKPKLLLCDEPTGNLDSKNSEIVIDLLDQLSTEFHSTLIVVTHDDHVAQHFSQGFHMEDGEIAPVQ